MPTQQRLRELFDYKDGSFIRAVCQGRKHRGDLVGCISKPEGYWTLRVDGRQILLHRAIWVYHYGSIPKGMVIDHIDHDPRNSRVENLRLASVTENNRNQSRRRSKHHTPYMGVNKARSGRWVASIEVDRRKKHLGTFDTPEEAHQARIRALGEHGYHPNHGKEKATSSDDVALAA
jgi:hypothetical protein